MPRKAIYTDIMEALERKIVAGEYMLKDLPGERKLAEEVGVSYMTARKAVLGLIDKEVLTRRANGSLEVHPRVRGHAGTTRVALLTPAYPSNHLVHCRMSASRVASSMDIQFRPFEYMYWYDSIVNDALRGSDGLIVMPSTEAIPLQTLKAFQAEGTKVVILDGDLTDRGIPSIRLFGRSHIKEVFEHLWKLGHRRIDCLNTQDRNDEIERRITHWQAWLAERGGEGTLWDSPAQAYADPTAQAHQAMRSILRSSDHMLSAIVCTTQPAAIGAIRACADLGVTVGRDISICAINNEPTGRFFCPSITGLELPDLEPMLSRCFDWFSSGQREWPENELLMTPQTSRMLFGESTGPAQH